MSVRRDLVVVAARRDTAVQVSAVLVDWSALGLVAPLLLVDVDRLDAAQPLIPASLIARGRAQSVILQNHLAARDRTDRARLVCITEVAGAASNLSSDMALRLLDGLRTSLPAAEVSPVHVISLTHKGRTPSEEVAWLGWHNVVLAPENAMGPDHGVLPIVYDPHDPVRRTHLVAGICSLAGLWSDRADGVFDGRAVPPARSLVAARSFSRHLSAQQVEAELLSRLSDVSNGYPVPQVDGESVEVIEDEASAAGDMADALVAKHAIHLKPRSRQMPAPRPPQQVSAMHALRMFFSFLGSALRNAPRDFLLRLTNEISARTASMVSGVVFGPGEAEYTVIVNGVRPDGLPASLGDLEYALSAAQNKVRAPGTVHHSTPDLGPVWKDFVAGGLTLIDGGNRSQELAPRERGARRAVVLTPARIAPDPDDVFITSEAVAAHLSDPKIRSFDVLAARQLDPELERLAQRQPHTASAAASTRQELREWGGGHQRSYVGRVGNTVALGMYQVRNEIKDLTTQLREITAAGDLPDTSEAQQRRLGSRLRWFLVAFLVVAAVLVGLFFGGIITGIILAAGLLASLVIWFVSSVVTFMKGQRDLFALLHRREELGSRAQQLEALLAEAFEDLVRLTHAYRQYVDWAQAFGSFAHRPFGAPEAAEEYDATLGSGLPNNHRFGAARPEKKVLDEAAARMRRGLCQVGWAGQAWDAFLADVPDGVGDDAFRVREERDVLFREVGSAGSPLLTRWSAAVAERTTWAAGVDDLRGRVDHYIDTAGAELTPRLLAHVETRTGASGEVETVGYDVFMSRLDQESDASHAFDRQMFSDRAQSAEQWRVVENVRLQHLTGLARSVVLTQLSDGFSSYDLAGNDHGTAPTYDPGPSVSDVHRPNF